MLLSVHCMNAKHLKKAKVETMARAETKTGYVISYFLKEDAWKSDAS